jgi:superfamily II DNA or RNA helicase
VRQLGLPAPDDVAAVISKLRAAAHQDIAAFKAALNTPSYVVALNLTLYDRDEASSFTVAGLAYAITTFNQITLVAPPGMGKTTTMLQAVDAILDRDSLTLISPWPSCQELLSLCVSDVYISRLWMDPGSH